MSADWFDRRLEGARVTVSHARAAHSALAEELSRLSAETPMDNEWANEELLRATSALSIADTALEMVARVVRIGAELDRRKEEIA